MKLSIKNICKIQEANIEINGITVIAGENNTGKSTVGKVLYCIFSGIYMINDQIFRARRDSIALKLLRCTHFNLNKLEQHLSINEKFDIEKRFEEMADAILTDMDDMDSINQITLSQKADRVFGVDDILGKNEDEDMEEMINQINEVLNISSETIIKNNLSRKFSDEFNGQINNIYTNNNGEIHIEIKNDDVNLVIKNNSVNYFKGDISLNSEIIYIDDPFIIDNTNSSFLRRPITFSRRLNHKEDLAFKLSCDNQEDMLDNIITTKKLNGVLEKLHFVCSGKMVKPRSRFGSTGYQTNDSDAILNIKNLSSGLKTFVILQTLLDNGVIKENGTIILDEPEIHLHPEWQLLFAEIIVLIQRDFNLHILINTHSPYFLKAIEVYSEKYNTKDKCKYYLAENIGNVSNIKDVTDNTESIYALLADPLQTLENVRYSDD